MKAPARRDDAKQTDPLAALSNDSVADLIASLRQLTDALEFHHFARLEAERSAFDDDQLDMWDDQTPF